MRHSPGITRRSFVERSSLFAAGTFLSRNAMFGLGPIPRNAKIGTYQIIVPAMPDSVEREAAEELQHCILLGTQKLLSINREGDHGLSPGFYLGRTQFATARRVDAGQLDGDGYHYESFGENLVIVGGARKGTLYGVYGLAESWGFRKFTSAALAVPSASEMMVPTRSQTYNPAVRYRTISYRDTRNPEYSNWHGLSSREDWGLFVHTFNELVSPERYGKTHPEYFSLVGQRRLPGTQLCLSNQDLVGVVVAALQERMKSKPSATYWSVSQNDNDQYCQCDACVALNKKYGDVPSGSILSFVNAVAKAFPDKIISTLAYWYSRTPPSYLQAAPNVNIMLCNIESKRQGPVYETDPAFSRDLMNWGKLARSILIWDYNIQFTNLVSPFPNLYTIKPNIKYYVDNHVNSLYMQANSQAGGEMAELRAYLICRLMWAPESDDRRIINEFLEGYYGKAAPYLRQYIEQMQAALTSTGFVLDIFGGPEDAKDTYLSREKMNEYRRLFDQAEKAVAGDAQLLERVRVTRLPIMYAEIQIGRSEEVSSPRGMFMHDTKGDVFVRPKMKSLVEVFVEDCNRNGVTRLRERSTTPDDYAASYRRIFTEIDEARHSKSIRKEIQSLTAPEGGTSQAQRLTDGIFGSWESWSAPDPNWVAYKGKHADFVLDLGEVMSISSVRMDFLNTQAQADWNLLILPEYVSYAVSVDGNAYDEERKIGNPHSPDPKENPAIIKLPVQTFRLDLGEKTRARYIKVHAHSVLEMPSWHIRAGRPAVIYTDQIVVA